MTKKEYLEELNVQLIRLNVEDRADALNYYSEYFDEAGEESIEQVMKELGSPEELARKFLNENEGSNNLTSRKTSNRNTVLILSLCIALALSLGGSFFIAKRVIGNTRKANNTSAASSGDQTIYEYSNDDLPAFKNISVDLVNTDVEIIPSTNGKYGIELKLVIYEDEAVTHDVIDVSTLLVQIENPHSSRSIAKEFSNVKQYVKIMVPADNYENFEITTTNGDITIELSENKLNNLDVTSSNGMLNIRNITCPNIDLTTCNDDIVITNIAGDCIVATTSNGDIQLQDSIIGSSATLTSSNADITLTLPGSANDYTFHAMTSNGSVSIGNKDYDEAVSLTGGQATVTTNTSNGDVDISFQ